MSNLSTSGTGHMRAGATPGTTHNGMGTASLVLGIIGLVLSWYWIAALPLGIVAICLGVAGRRRAAQGQADNRGSATAGMVLGIVAVVLAVAFVAIVAATL
ncbi:DUF4190 domain-containing protein [Streptomyces sp. AcH 505]|uniref:DUF4190 domain-containing protein n=1 Tax=Streptomyces sp. AcH 505 TaxID=352211 RepID=UPI00099DBAA1